MADCSTTKKCWKLHPPVTRQSETITSACFCFFCLGNKKCLVKENLSQNSTPSLSNLSYKFAVNVSCLTFFCVFFFAILIAIACLLALQCNNPFESAGFVNGAVHVLLSFSLFAFYRMSKSDTKCKKKKNPFELLTKYLIN